MPMFSRFRFLVPACLLLAAGACSSSSTSPSSSTSITAPRPSQPADGTQVTFASQPVTLVVANASVTGGQTATYAFEVATDTAFASKVQTKTGVAEGSNGQTRVTLDSLAGGRDYYWHARADSGGTTGAFGVIYRFAVGSAVTLSAPSAVSPLTGATTGTRPTLVVTNTVKTGSAGAITYKFDISISSTFSSIALTQTVNEGTTQTNFTPSSDLTTNQTFFWRATATDAANGVSSTASATQSFTTAANTPQQVIANQQGVTLWPGVQPTGTTGHASLGPGWGIGTDVSFTGVAFSTPPLEALRIYDLIDRGMDPGAAIAWMQANGYSTTAVYYPEVLAVGLQWQYIAQVFGKWELVHRVGA